MSKDGVHPASLDDETLLSQCKAGTSRSSGPGGQHRNKVETAVTLTHQPTGISAQASERRSQAENKKIALRRLKLKLAVEHREIPFPSDVDSQYGSALWRQRRQGDRIPCNARNRDYPALLAEALDVLMIHAFDPKQAGQCLGITPTQLVRLCSEEPAALSLINEVRKRKGQRALR